jgi:hypothetical protein
MVFQYQSHSNDEDSGDCIGDSIGDLFEHTQAITHLLTRACPLHTVLQPLDSPKPAG